MTGKKKEKLSRREFLKAAGRFILFLLLFIPTLYSILRKKLFASYFWQIDPEKCVKCGRCATACVLKPSAVKCVHQYELCGYCNLCFGYFQPGASQLNESAENQLCPTNAINRKFIEEPFFEYSINEKLCMACAKCVKGCNLFGNGSLFLQINRDLCKNCNECSIARVCAGNAFRRVRRNLPYLKK